MNKIKILFIVLSMFLLSGCTVYYDLNIDEDLYLTENIHFESKDVLFDENSSITQEDYETFMNNLKSSANEYKYQLIDNTVNNDIDLTLKKTTPFLDFKDPVFLENKYEKFNTFCTDKYCSLTASVVEETIIGEGDVIYYNIGISVPYKVIKHNANYFDSKRNIYYWYHSPLDEPTNIEFVFNKSGTNVVKNNEIKNKTKNYIWVIIGTIVLVGIGIVTYKVVNNSKPRL